MPQRKRNHVLFRVDQSLTNNSYYAATAPREQRFPPLEESVECDVAIVGGGLAGMSAAIELADRGLDVVLLEAQALGFGASGRNGGQAFAGLACDQSVIEQQLGMDASRTVWTMTLEAIELIHERCRRFGIDCDWRPGYLSLAVNPRKGRELAEWYAHMQRESTATGDADRTVRDRPLDRQPRASTAACTTRCRATCTRCGTVLGLGRAAARLVRIHEETPVTALAAESRRPSLSTPRGQVRARHAAGGQRHLQGSRRCSRRGSCRSAPTS